MAKQNRKPQPLEPMQVRENLKILTARLTEPHTRIDNQLRPLYPAGQSAAEGPSESRSKRTPDRAREWPPLHGFGPAAEMHQDQPRALTAGRINHSPAKPETTHGIRHRLASAG